MGLIDDQGQIKGPQGPIGGPSVALPSGGSPARTGGVTYTDTPPLGPPTKEISTPPPLKSGGIK